MVGFDVPMPGRQAMRVQRLLVLSLLAAWPCVGALAGSIFEAKYESQADVKVAVVKYESQADLCVYVVDYESQARDSDALWYYVDYQSQADAKIYFVQYESQADIKVFFVKYQSQAGWKKSNPWHGRLRRKAG
jgi:hypothetical protein